MNIIGHLTSCFHWVVNGLCGAMGGVFSFLVTIEKVLCQFLLKIRNWPVMTCVDLRSVFLTNRLKRALSLQTQARTSNLELQKELYGIEVLSK